MYGKTLLILVDPRSMKSGLAFIDPARINPGAFHEKRAALYLRVSTVDQTTANQERELREIAGRIELRYRQGLQGSRHQRRQGPRQAPGIRRASAVMLVGGSSSQSRSDLDLYEIVQIGGNERSRLRYPS